MTTADEMHAALFKDDCKSKHCQSAHAHRNHLQQCQALMRCGDHPFWPTYPRQATHASQRELRIA